MNERDDEDRDGDDLLDEYGLDVDSPAAKPVDIGPTSGAGGVATVIFRGERDAYLSAEDIERIASARGQYLTAEEIERIAGKR